ncbi:MAG TPA: extracellular solute-binding protein [Thermotogota bacterium]|nr:extracellular solute-binding protein [Thermotogota bacterium]HPJ88797.1 extracellular solute-binding protein [Thermotogota bacterium]HPR97298.1 extracellular solute-binding protein [Thermotogota bacterium]
MKKCCVVFLILAFMLVSLSFAKSHIVWLTHWTDFQLNGVENEDGTIATKGLQQYIDEYQSMNPTVEIEIQSVPFEEYLKKILIGHTAGKVADIYGLYSLWGVQLLDSAILDSVPSDVEKLIKEEGVEAAVKGVTIEGKIRGIPMEIDNYAFLYNKKILAEAGYDAPPSTWEEMCDMAGKLTVIAEDGTTNRYGFAFLSGWDSAVVHPYLSLLYSLGGRMFSEDYSKCLLDSPEAIKALEEELVLFNNGATDPAASVYDFATGKVAMIIMAPWYETSLKIAFKDDYEQTVGVAPIPKLKEQISAGYTWLLAVDRMSDVKAESWEFLKWLAFDKTEQGRTRLGELMALNIGGLPTMKTDLTAFPDELRDLYTSVFIDELKNTVSEPNVFQGQEIKLILMRQIVEAWHKEKTPEAALKEATKEIDEILSEYYF